MKNKFFLTLIVFLFCLSIPINAVDYRWKKKKDKMALVKKKKGEKTVILTDFIYDAKYEGSRFSWKKKEPWYLIWNYNYRDKDSEKVFRVRRDGKIGLLDSYGKEILPCEYDDIKDTRWYENEDRNGNKVSYHSIYKKSEGWGIVKITLSADAMPKAEITTPCQYNNIEYVWGYYYFSTDRFLEGENVEIGSDYDFVNGKYTKIGEKVVTKYYSKPYFLLLERDRWRGLNATYDRDLKDDYWEKSSGKKQYVRVSRSKGNKKYYGLLDVVNNTELIPTDCSDLYLGHAHHMKKDYSQNFYYITHGSEHIYCVEKDTTLALYSNTQSGNKIYESKFKVNSVSIRADKRTLLLNISGDRNREYLCLGNKLVIPHEIDGEFNALLSDEMNVFKIKGNKLGLYNAKLQKQLLPKGTYWFIFADQARSGWFYLKDTADVYYQAFMPTNRDTVIIFKDKAELLDICHAEDYGHNNSLLQYGNDYGFYFGDTDFILPCSYDSIRPSRQVLPALSEDFEGVYLTYKNSRVGLIAKNGVVAPPIFQTILVNNNSLEMKINDIPEIWTLHTVKFSTNGYIRPSIMVTAQKGECSGQMNFTEMFRDINSRSKWHAMLSLGAYMDNTEVQGLATVYYALSNDLETRQGVETAEKYLNVAKKRYGYNDVKNYMEMVAEARTVVEQREAEARQAAYEEQQRLAEERRRQRQEGLMLLSQTLGQLGQDLQKLSNNSRSKRRTTTYNNTSSYNNRRTRHNSSNSSGSTSSNSSSQYVKKSCSGGTPMQAKFKCGGTGKCYRCNGTGIYNPSLESPYSKITKDKCPTCNGTGICTMCGGKGYKMKRVR